jgi:hypothetical protein
MKPSEIDKNKQIVLISKEEQADNPFFESILTPIDITPEMFTSIQGKMAPNKELINRIADGMGIEFSPEFSIEDVYGDKEFKPDGSYTMKVVGHRCVKRGRRRRVDGSWHPSSDCVYEFNFKDRAEEEYINWLVKGNKENNNKKMQIYLKLKKFSTTRASTGAALSVVKELSKMPSGFDPKMIRDKPVIVVSQVVKTKEYQFEEAKARMDNIRNGGNIATEVNSAVKMLTGNDINVQEEFHKPEPEPEATPEKPKDFAEFAKQQTAPDTFESLTTDLEAGKLSIAEAYDKIMDLDVIKNHEGYDNAVDVVGDNGGTDEVKEYIINSWKGLI